MESAGAMPRFNAGTRPLPGGSFAGGSFAGVSFLKWVLGALSGRGSLQPQYLGYLSFILDLGIFLAAGAFASKWVGEPGGDIYRLAQVLTGLLLAVIFLGCGRVGGIRDPLTLLRERPSVLILKTTLCFGAAPAAALLACMPFAHSSDPTVRGFLVWLACFALAAASFAALSRAIFRLLLPIMTTRMLTPQRIVIVGSGESARRLIRWVDTTAPGLFQVSGIFDDRDKQRTSQSELAGLIRGNTSDLIDFYKRSSFEKIVIALPHSAEDRLLFLLRRLRQLPVDIVLAPDLMGFRPPRGQMNVAGLKLVSLAHRPIREPQRLLKGAIDRTAAALSLLALSPLLLGVALAIKLDSRGPVLFRQPRQGLGDSLFDVFKFRTMYRELEDVQGEQQTQRTDPRVTRIGGWLRRASIDELPQLLNVLRGEMSLVGPRPHTPHMLIGDKRHFELVDEYSFRHRVKPGITGLAQVSGFRGAVHSPEHLRARVNFDLYYIDHWSLWLDIKIVFRTAFICVSGVNAF